MWQMHTSGLHAPRYSCIPQGIFVVCFVINVCCAFSYLYRKKVGSGFLRAEHFKVAISSLHIKQQDLWLVK